MHIDRLRTMKYISPSGLEFILQFEDLERSGGKKAPVSEYPGQNQAGVQDLGNLTPTYPISCYITGQDYDTEADRFFDALHETGPGKLIHPRWGNLSVLPTQVVQAEKFVAGAGLAAFSITFIRASLDSFEFPKASAAPAAIVTANVGSAVTAIVESVPEELTQVGEIAGTKAEILNVLDEVTEGFDNITGLTDDIRADIDQAVRDITSEIDDLVESPADLMTSMLQLFRYPATVDIDVEAKIDGYATIYSNIIDGFITTANQYGEGFGAIAAGILAALGLSAAESTTAGDISTRDEAGQVVSDLDSLNSTINDSMQDIEDAGSFSAAYELQQTLELTMSAALSGLIDRALNLPAERSIIMDREVPPTVLCYELFGSLDNLDDWMNFNRFVDDEILLIPRGREVRWYA